MKHASRECLKKGGNETPETRREVIAQAQICNLKM